MAMVRLLATVRIIVMKNKARSPARSLIRSAQRDGSLISHAVRMSSPASAGIVRYPASAAAATLNNKIVSAWTIPDIGVRPPARTFVAVLAIAPVAGRPPNNGEMIFAAP